MFDVVVFEGPDMLAEFGGVSVNKEHPCSSTRDRNAC